MPFFTRKNKKPLGIYIHIPFCRSKCVYCDFYSLANRDSKLMDQYRKAICEPENRHRAIWWIPSTLVAVPPASLALTV